MKQKSNAAMVWTLLVGAALGAGATLLLTPERKRVKESIKALLKAKNKKGDKATEGTICSVPAADICFPEK